MQKFVVTLFSLMLLAACSRPFHAAEPPLRDADIYPDARMHAGLAVAVDEISDPDRIRRYFGADLRSKDILPIMLIFSNHDIDRFRVVPLDVLLLDGSNVIDPVPNDHMAGIVRGNKGLFLQETVIPPNGSYQGVVFYRVKSDTGMYGNTGKLFIGNLTMRIGVNDLDSKERFVFGPFSLSAW